MESRKVSVVKCTEYRPELLEQKIRESLENIGFDTVRFSGARVALKPNLLLPSEVEKAIITHPEFFRAVARIVKQSGGMPFLIESPCIHSLPRTLDKTPYRRMLEEEGVEAADNEPTRTVRNENAVRFKNIDVSAAFFDADIIVSLPKFKTHGLTYMTGAVKNLLGTIPGLQKSKMHVKLPSADEFSDFLLDLYGAMRGGFDKPKELLHIMDAIVGQEGEGPGTAGTPKALNAIFAAWDAVGLDYVATKASGLDPDRAPTIVKGMARGLGPARPQEIEVVGDDVKSLGNQPFEASRGTFMSNMIRWPMNTKWFKNLMIDRPWPREEICTLCYQCRKICPAGAISKATDGKKTPAYDYDICIRCYCCMEACPEAAITRKAGKLQWLSRL
ncbi:MAG: DUF362 domain-containing protein [Thermodesulfobacteriota bacterium]